MDPSTLPDLTVTHIGLLEFGEIAVKVLSFTRE